MRSDILLIATVRNRVFSDSSVTTPFFGRSIPAYTEILGSLPNTSPVAFGMRFSANGRCAPLFWKATAIRKVRNVCKYYLWLLTVIQSQLRIFLAFGYEGFQGSLTPVRRRQALNDQKNEPRWKHTTPLAHSALRPEVTMHGLVYTNTKIAIPRGG